MAWRSELDGDAKTTKKLSSTLTAAGVAGIKKFVSERGTSAEGYHGFDDRSTQALNADNREPLDLDKNNLSTRSLAVGHTGDHSQEPEGPSIRDNFNSEGSTTERRVPKIELETKVTGDTNPASWRDSGDTFITSQSTPLKKRLGGSLWDSHRSLGPFDVSSFNRPKPIDESTFNPRNVSWLDAQIPNSGASPIRSKEPWRPKLVQQRGPKLAIGILMTRYYGAILICFAILMSLPIATMLSNSKIESLLGRGDVKPWMKVFNTEILKELDRADCRA